MRRIFLLLSTLVVLASTLSFTTCSSANAATDSLSVWVEPSAGYGFFYQALASAKHEIDLSMYELRDAIAENDLAQAAARGVNVQVLLNAAYDGKSENASAYAFLRAHHVHVVYAPSNQIFHAKYLVIDDQSAYIGTGNLVTSDYTSTRDFWVRDTSPSDVTVIVQTFSNDVTHHNTSPVGTSDLVWSPSSTGALVQLIGQAQHSLLIENEEMYSYTIEDALVAASTRGVDVTVVMTKDAQYLNDLKALVAKGVHVDLLGSSQLYIHAKVICVDCTASTGSVFVGSENFSTASLDYNRELGIITSTPSVVQAVRSAVLSDAALGTPLS